MQNLLQKYLQLPLLIHIFASTKQEQNENKSHTLSMVAPDERESVGCDIA